MIANARMYSVSPEAAGLWHALLAGVIERAGVDVQLLEHAEPAPIGELWQRPDMAGVFMCGLPYSRSDPKPRLLAAPVPAPPAFQGLPQYWSDMVVRKDSPWQSVQDTFGGRLALTVPGSQSGCLAALGHLMTVPGDFPLYREVIAPQVTPRGALTAVVEGAADIAPIDSYAFALMQKFRPDLTSQVRSVAQTAHTPIPPLVASAAAQPDVAGSDALRSAFLEAHRIESLQPLMAGLLLERFVLPDPQSYQALRLNFEAATAYWSQHRLAATQDPAFG